MFRKKTPQETPTLWIATSDLPATPATGFYAKLDQALADMQRRAEALVAARTDVPRTYRLRGGRHVD